MKQINVVGLGAGDLEQLPLGVYKVLKEADMVYLRTKEHPVVKNLEEEGLHYQSFDDIYEKHEQFSAVYEEITDVLLSKAQEKDIVYAVPGHPLVAEKTVQLLLEHSKEKGIEVSILGGQSFLDPLFTALKIDPIDGFQMLDATSLKRSELSLNQHMIICQVYDAFIASEVKLTLMEQLPDEYEVAIITAAGTKEEQIKKVKLYELDRGVTLNNLTSVYVPPVKEEHYTYHRFDSLRHTIATLRGPNGCPWDKEQTHESLKKYLIEETYELIDAINREDDENIIEELGDILLQVMLHAQIGEDEGWFSIDDVIRTINEKMIRRHPHVFGDVSVKNSTEVVQNWDAIKEQEKGKNNSDSVLDDVPKSFPALLKAYHYQKRAGKIGFDWDEVEPMWEKVAEEIEEFKAEVSKTNIESQSATLEFGDVLFALVNISRFYKIDPEEALASTNQKFYQRFSYIEQKIKQSNKSIDDYTLEELDMIWNEAKRKGL